MAVFKSFFVKICIRAVFSYILNNILLFQMGLIRFTFFSSIIFAAILFIPMIPPGNHVKFTEFHVAPSKNLEGVLALNTVLNNAERLFEKEIKGPEAFTVLDGELYTTLHGGYVAKVYEDQIIPVVKFGQPCGK